VFMFVSYDVWCVYVCESCVTGYSIIIIGR